MKIKKQKVQNAFHKKKTSISKLWTDCLEEIQLENKMNHLEKNEINIDSLKKIHNEFIGNNKSILKIQQRFKSERNNVFTKEIEKIVLSSNYDKRM